LKSKSLFCTAQSSPASCPVRRKVWSAAKVTKAPAPRYCVLFLTVIRHRRQERTAIESHRVSHDDEGNLARTCSLRSHAWESVGRMEGTSTCTRISPFAGWVTEAAAVRKDRPAAERAGLRPFRQHVSRCSDALRARTGDIEVSGRRRAGAHRRVLHVRVQFAASSTRFRSRPARVMSRKRIARVRSHPRAWPPTSQGCTSLRL
jgi:hypothetical protein